MPKPTRIELLKKFFPNLGDADPGAETEESVALNTRSAEAILADLINVFDCLREQKGDGVLGLRLIEPGDGFYLTVDDLCSDLLSAEAAGDRGSVNFLKDAIRVAKSNNFDEFALLLLVDNSGARLSPIPRDYPAKGVQILQEEATV